MIEIDVATLRRAISKLLDHLEGQGVKSVSLDKDFYWQVGEGSLYEVEQNPSDLEIGQLSEDWEHVRRVANGSADALAFSLCWLAPILRAVGEKVVR